MRHQDKVVIVTGAGRNIGEETAKLFFSGKGYRGTCLDYVRNTVEVLQQLGLRDQDLERTLTFAEIQAHPTTGLQTP